MAGFFVISDVEISVGFAWGFLSAETQPGSSYLCLKVMQKVSNTSKPLFLKATFSISCKQLYLSGTWPFLLFGACRYRNFLLRCYKNKNTDTLSLPWETEAAQTIKKEDKRSQSPVMLFHCENLHVLLHHMVSLSLRSVRFVFSSQRW